MIYHFIVAVLQPFPLCYLLALVVVLRVSRTHRAARKPLRWAIVPLLLLGLISLPIVGHLALGSLEWQYPAEKELSGDAGVIVVLSGYVRPPRNTATDVELGSDTLLRCLHAAKLYKAKPRLVLVSGGKVLPDTPGPTLAAAMRGFLLEQGVKEEHLLIEDRSSTTHENALLSGDILTGRGISKIILVTSASHMPRGQRCFRALGFQVVPAPCDYRTARSSWSLSDFLLPNPEAATAVELAAHEWLGMAWYWLCGRI
jgi:uncharacterized SAM-binding protein YcdF (DUF218 family)